MILFRYILRNHAGPFLFSIVTLFFIFLFNFLTKAADRLIGKGLGTWVIFKLITFNLAWMVVLVVPMAVLVATLMAYGNMSSNNEIAIMKASGVSIYKMIAPAFLASIVIGFLLVEFNNEIYPDANHAARLLMQDVSNKKPTLSLVPGLFSQEVPNYSILVREIDEKSNILKGVTLYDYSEPGKLNIVTAETGKIYFSRDQKKLIMDLFRGEIHESSPSDKTIYRKLIFNKHRILMDAEQFSFQQSTPGGPRYERELSAPDMMVIVDSLENIRNDLLKRLQRNSRALISLSSTKIKATNDSNGIIYNRVAEKLKAARNAISSDTDYLTYNIKEINKYLVEVHKKYSIPFACIVFVLIGAPLGIMTRKGGIGVAAGISILFFLVYWAFLIGGEKLADRGLLSPFWGMWSANVVLGSLGVFLTYRSAKETVNLNLSFLQKLIPASWKTTAEENENS